MKLLTRLPFTAVTLLTYVGTAIASGTHLDSLPSAWLHAFGFAPRDLWRGEWRRLFTSVLVTHGPRPFWGGLLVMGAAVGSAEYRAGTRRTALTFWSVHLMTLLLLTWAIVRPLHRRDVPLMTAVAVARDVGPSAGYFGCFGLLLAYLPRSLQPLLAGSVSVWLLVSLFVPTATNVPRASKLSADAAHLVAFPLGWLAGKLSRAL